MIAILKFCIIQTPAR